MSKQIRQVSPVDPMHMVHFYDDDEPFLDQWRDFASVALSGGSSAFVILSQEHNARFSQKLSACGVDTCAATREGRYQVFDAEEVLSAFYRNGIFDECAFYRTVEPVLQRAIAASHEGVLAMAEMVNLLVARGEISAAIELEQFWNRLTERYSFTLRCGYSIEGFSHAERGLWVPDICSLHTHAFFGNSHSNQTT